MREGNMRIQKGKEVRERQRTRSSIIKGKEGNMSEAVKKRTRS